MFARKIHWSHEARRKAEKRKAAATRAMKLGVVGLGVVAAALTLVVFESFG